MPDPRVKHTTASDGIVRSDRQRSKEERKLPKEVSLGNFISPTYYFAGVLSLAD